jgi:para-nitrobenzyl esterase
VVEGFEDQGIQVFRGIPYARPPVGELRFAAPQPPEPWRGVRDATRFGGSPPQIELSVDFLPGMEVGPQSEDCLTLNLATPARDGAARPVLVFLHGGGFAIGSGSQPLYDPRALARRGDAVVVTLNYRLGALGFLHLDHLAGRAFGAEGNAGLLDQVAALRWVRANAAAFGGDPGRVAIFGESAGGMSVATLLALPAARGLFQRAIAQSGAAHNVHDAAGATRVAEELLEELGAPCSQLRQLPVERILEAQARVLARHHGDPRLLLPFQPVVDGRVLPAPPLEALRRGAAGGVPALIGTTRDEFSVLGRLQRGLAGLDQAALAERAGERVGAARAPGLLAAYREALPGASPAALFDALETDRLFRIPALRLEEALRAGGSRTFMYLFTWESAFLGGRLGACHGIELPFVFGAIGSKLAEAFAGGGSEAQELSRNAMDAWLGFARRGEPGHPGLPEWPPCDARRRATMLLGRVCALAEAPEEARRRAWEGLL